MAENKRRVWVTGANGFIGAHVARHLSAAGMEVIGFGRRAWKRQETFLAHYVEGGVSAEAVEGVLETRGCPEVVYHFAGGASVGSSLANPYGDFESSVLTTAGLFEKLREKSPDTHVVLASSAAVYGSGHAGAIGVDAALDPYSPYGAHKLMAEQLGRSYAKNFGFRVSILRLFSIYGPGIRKQLLYEVCKRMAASVDPVVLGGTGNERRDWCHVADVARLCACLPEAVPGVPSVYNVGHAVGEVIANIGKLLVSAWGEGHEIRFTGEACPGDPFSLLAAPESLPEGFEPSLSLEEGIEEFVDVFRRVE